MAMNSDSKGKQMTDQPNILTINMSDSPNTKSNSIQRCTCPVTCLSASEATKHPLNKDPCWVKRVKPMLSDYTT